MREMQDIVQYVYTEADLKAYREHEAVAHSNDDNEGDDRCRDTSSEEVFHLKVAFPSPLVFHHNGRYSTLDTSQM